MSEAYWWCNNRKMVVGAHSVTYQEVHEDCGHPVEWIIAEEAGLVDSLRATVERQRAEIDTISELYRSAERLITNLRNELRKTNELDGGCSGCRNEEECDPRTRNSFRPCSECSRAFSDKFDPMNDSIAKDTAETERDALRAAKDAAEAERDRFSDCWQQREHDCFILQNENERLRARVAELEKPSHD